MEPNWIDAEDGYQLALHDGVLLCRNPKGKQLKSVPSSVRKGVAAERLLHLRDWLEDHERDCAETVERFMLRSLPVPRAMLASVWDDPAWQRPFRDAVVAVLGDEGRVDTSRAGFLRAVDPKRGVGVVDLDGETVWLDAERVTLPHPILLDARDDYRELATDLGIQQGISQLFREIFERPADVLPGTMRIEEWANGKFEQLNHAIGRCRTLGYRVRGGFACCTVWERYELVEARYWIGAEAPEYETYTGELSWVDDRERPLELAAVGPVAFSEGTRMARSIYAARKVEEAP